MSYSYKAVQASQILYICISSLTGVRVGQGLTYR